jgi:hypothetical protein
MKAMIKPLTGNVRAYSKPNRIQPRLQDLMELRSDFHIRHRCGMPAHAMHQLLPERRELLLSRLAD